MSLYITNCHKLSQRVTTTCHDYVSLLRVTTTCHYMSLYVTIRHYMSYFYILLHTNHALAVLLVASGCICWGCFSHLCKSWHIAPRCSTLLHAFQGTLFSSSTSRRSHDVSGSDVSAAAIFRHLRLTRPTIASTRDSTEFEHDSAEVVVWTKYMI